MPKDAPSNGGAALVPRGPGSFQRASGTQTKLHCWAAADPGRRFDDCSISCVSRATPLTPFVRVAGKIGVL
jgi:RNA-directed DNA polymerase